MCSCGVCSHPWFVCEVDLVPYVDAVTVMGVLLFVLHVCMLREREGDGNAGMGDGGTVASVGHVVGSGIVYGTADVLGMGVVHGMRGVGGVCEMCMCLTRDCIREECVGG